MSFLLLIPGLLCDAALWHNQIDALKNRVTCLVPDTTRHDSIAAIARAVLADAPPRFAVAGTSMGGYVAFEILRQAPQRVERLAIFSSNARADTPQQQEKRRLLLTLSRSGQFKGVTPRLLPTLIHPDRITDTALTGLVTSMAERVGREAFQNQQTAILNRIDSRPFLKDITCPTLVAGGDQDAVTPPDLLKEIADAIPHSRYATIENCGHLSPLERPQEVNRLMTAWLDG